jgi:hypothetical protein
LLLDKEEQGDKQDFSELVQNLLDFWVEIQQGENADIGCDGITHFSAIAQVAGNCSIR